MENLEPTENFAAPLPKENAILNAAEPTPNNPPWNGWTALGIWVLSIIFIALLPELVLIPYLISKNVDFSDRSGLLEFILTDPTAIILRLGSIIPAHLFTLLIAWLAVTRFGTFSFRQTLGWNLGKFKVWHGLALFVFFYLTALAMLQLFGDVENEFDRLLKSSRTAVYLVAFFATFTAPLVEEVIYRGLLYSAFQRRFGVAFAVFLVTVLFTFVHIPQYSNNGVPDYAAVILLLLLSLTLTLIRVRTNNLLPCVIFHTIVNGIQSILLIIEPYVRQMAEQSPPPTAFFFDFFK
ncbi:MAG TPA: CPBP family intramembrane glutamic endopeptidase [Pyrinomonadaceae bacterium]